jgi:hypothetical protein
VAPRRAAARESIGAAGAVRMSVAGSRRWTAPLVILSLIGALVSGRALAIEGDTVVLQGLDKVTARVWTFEARIGEAVRFGTLEIYPRFCDRTPPEEPPESKAFLDIYEARPGEERADLFHGWMFASSPALNAFEHPVYDVWLIDCKATQPVMPPPSGEASESPSETSPSETAPPESPR